MTPDSLRQARDVMARDGVRAFSFDVFDTILLRRTKAPDGVYERAFDLAPIPAHRRGQRESFVQHRQLAEFRARDDKAKATRRINEVAIEEIYAYFPLHVFDLPEAARAELAAAEFAAEKELCFANQDILALYREARGRGLRTGFLSDTYWSRARLEELLRHAIPDLAFDFLYPSCEFGLGKALGLFVHALEREGLRPADLAHMGDNPAADVQVPAGLGVATVFYPQLEPRQAVALQRERTYLRMMRAERPAVFSRVDGGLAVLRRLVTARLAVGVPPHRFAAVSVMAPAMWAFQRLVETRVAAVEAATGCRPVVLFIARDGYLPFCHWRAAGHDGHYIEVNRRVVLIARSVDFSVLQQFIVTMKRVTLHNVESLFKAELPALRDWFAEQPDGVAGGVEVALALPRLVTSEQLEGFARSMRTRFMTYLRATVPDFDAASDVMVVDLGYSGTMQKGLSALFRLEGLQKRVHGVYVISVSETMANLNGGDTAHALVDDAVMAPMSKRVMLRNVSLLEQFCCSPAGSVLDYDGARATREPDLRTPAQITFIDQAQRDSLAAARLMRDIAAEWGLDPFADFGRARAEITAILGRFFQLPTIDEFMLLGRLEQDVNLGTSAIVTLSDPGLGRMLVDTLPFPQICHTGMPPAWLAASFASVSAMAGLAYALSGFTLVPDDALNETEIGQVEATLIKDGAGTRIPVGVAQTGFGEYRFRFPVLGKHAGSVVAVPLARVMRRGVIRAFQIQRGQESFHAIFNRSILPQPLDGIQAMGATLKGPYFEADGPDPHLVFPIPAEDYPLLLVTITLIPLDPPHV